MEWLITQMLTDICGTDLYNSVSKTLQYNVFSESRFAPAVNIVKTLSDDVIVPIATMLICMYFLINIIEKMSSETFTWEQLGRLLAMLLVGKFLIENGYEILTQLYSIGVELIDMVVEKLGTGDSAAADVNVAVDMYKKMKEKTNFVIGFFVDIIYLLLLLIPWFISWGMRLVVKVICYSRMIEILVRASFSPIALSDFFQNGLNGSGWRWLKNFFAICLQGVIIMAITLLYSALLGGVMNDALFEAEGVGDFALFQFCGVCIALMASAVMLMFKSLSIAKEILGTGN